MAEKRFFNFIELKYNDLTNQVNTWLQGIFNKSNTNLGPGSPYGQVINLQKELFQHNIIYLKNVANQIDIAETTNDKVVKNISVISGHNIGRAISATGTLGFQLKVGIDIQKEIKDSVVIIQGENKSVIRNNTNNLDYTLVIGTTKNTYPIKKNSPFFIPIIQGKYETQKYTGTGNNNQSLRVNVPTTASIENFNYIVKYNGNPLINKVNLYDMLPNESAYYAKTGFNGGLDIFFGDGNYGFIPLNGSVIEVTYLLSNGSAGDVLNPVVNDWRFISDITDGQGNSIKMENLFDIWVETNINFSSDGESMEQTKNNIPHVSRNFVLATPDQFIYHLSRLNIFSKVNAYNKLDDNNFSVTENVVESAINKLTKSINQNLSKQQINNDLNNFLTLYSQYKTNLNDNEIYLYLIPDIKKYFNDSVNYFNISFDAFYLDNDEQQKVLSYLRQIGTLSPTVNIKILQPSITRYVMHVYIRRFSDALEDNISQEVIANISNYFLTSTRYDRIPRADLVALIKAISGVDSASVYFVSQANEDYHSKAISLGYTPANGSTFAPTPVPVTTANRQQTVLTQPMIKKNGVVLPKQAYNPNLLIGIDMVHGDIVIGKDEHAIIRGGWRDRNGIFYNENPNQIGLNSINIVFNGITQK